eukprot:10740124-Heterocapsa_arctica.AAC.1
MGLPYVAPRKAVAAAPRNAQSINALAALAQRMVGDPKTVPSAAPKIVTPPPVHLGKAKGIWDKERSRSAPIPKP